MKDNCMRRHVADSSRINKAPTNRPPPSPMATAGTRELQDEFAGL